MYLENIKKEINIFSMERSYYNSEKTLIYTYLKQILRMVNGNKDIEKKQNLECTLSWIVNQSINKFSSLEIARIHLDRYGYF